MPTPSTRVTGFTRMAMRVCCFAPDAQGGQRRCCAVPTHQYPHRYLMVDTLPPSLVELRRTDRLAHPTNSARRLVQPFRDLNRVQRSSLQQLVRRCEYRDRMAGGIAEIPPDAADQDVILA